MTRGEGASLYGHHKVALSPTDLMACSFTKALFHQDISKGFAKDNSIIIPKLSPGR